MENSGATSRGFIGTLNNVQLADVLQMCCIGGTSTAIRVTQNGLEGTIYLVEGEIVHAEAGNFSGERAFFRLWVGIRAALNPIWANGQTGPQSPLTGSTSLWKPAEDRMKWLCFPPVENTSDEDMPLTDNNDTPIRVLIVDDSTMMRKALAQIFDVKDFLIVGNATNGEEALDLILRVDPDVITMDVNMPVMDGISALKRIMIQFPLPTVMVSSMTQDGSTITFDALKYGAVDFIPKPSQLNGEDKEKQCHLIREKVRLASKIAINSVRYIRTGLKDKQAAEIHACISNVVCMVGAEGGYGALLKIIPQLTPDLPAAYLVVLYAAPEHVDAFARYLDLHSRVKVKRATNGDSLQGGVCYLVSGKEYATIEPLDEGLILQLTPSSFPNRRGAADILMISLAEKIGPGALGIVLSGDAADGSDSLNEILHTGGDALIQSPETCLLKEMPEAAIAKCTRAQVVSDDEMASEISRIIRSRGKSDPSSDPC